MNEFNDFAAVDDEKAVEKDIKKHHLIHIPFWNQAFSRLPAVTSSSPRSRPKLLLSVHQYTYTCVYITDFVKYIPVKDLSFSTLLVCV